MRRFAFGARSAPEPERAPLNTLLAGPILRRAEPRRVCIWLATSKPVQARAEIFDLGGDHQPGRRIGGGESERLQLGPRLYIHLIQAVPDGDAFPVQRLLAYDIELFEGGASSRQGLRDLGLLGRPDGIAYGNLPLPSFFLRAEASPLHFLHGSWLDWCRSRETRLSTSCCARRVERSAYTLPP